MHEITLERARVIVYIDWSGTSNVHCILGILFFLLKLLEPISQEFKVLKKLRGTSALIVSWRLIASNIKTDILEKLYELRITIEALQR